MAFVTLDTYEQIENLKKAGVPEKQAKAIIDALKVSQIDLATKHDFDMLFQKADQFSQKMDQFPTKHDLKLLEQKMEHVEEKMDHYATKVELANLKSDIIRWIIGLFFAQAGLFFALLKFVR